MKIHWSQAWRSGTLLVVALVAAVNVIAIARRVPTPAIDPPESLLDPVVQHERRFAALRDRVREYRIRGTAGYFGESTGADDAYYYAQFVLLPLILDLNPEPHAWAVAHLPATPLESRLPAGWRSVAAFGGGVFLLKKDAP